MPSDADVIRPVKTRDLWFKCPKLVLQITSTCTICFQMSFAGENSSGQDEKCRHQIHYWEMEQLRVCSIAISKCTLCTEDTTVSQHHFHHCVITCGYRVTLWPNLSCGAAALQLTSDGDKRQQELKTQILDLIRAWWWQEKWRPWRKMQYRWQSLVRNTFWHGARYQGARVTPGIQRQPAAEASPTSCCFPLERENSTRKSRIRLKVNKIASNHWRW